jgi:uncharacterized membrane protein
MLASLVLPIVVSAVALFFASFLSWMVLPFHRKDWVKLPNEDQILPALRTAGIPAGSYMFPGCNNRDEMNTDEFKAKQKSGPVGIITVFGDINMGRNLALTLLYFLVVSFCLAYLATLALKPGAEFVHVFRFVTTAGFMTFLAATIQHAIWFRNRIVGHVIESVPYAAITGAIFALMWPSA